MPKLTKCDLFLDTELLEELKVECGVRDSQELMNLALTFLRWASAHRKNGIAIVALDPETGTAKELVVADSPLFQALLDQDGSTRSPD